MPFFKVRVIEQNIHEFYVKADTEQDVAEIDVDEAFADLCSANAGFFGVEHREVDEVEEVDEDEVDTELLVDADAVEANARRRD